MPEKWKVYLGETEGKERSSALKLLREIVNDGNACLSDDALELAYENGRTDTDSLRQCYYLIAKKEYHPEPLKLIDSVSIDYHPNLRAYDSLMGGGQNE